MPPAPLPYSKEDKFKKPHRPFVAPSPHSQPRLIYILAIVSFLCLLVGVIGIVFSLSVLSGPPRTVAVYRCGRSEDTLRTFRSRSGAGADGDARPKLLGFVGIQTGFDSAERRAALRSTWFPSDPDGLLKYVPILYFFWLLI